MSERNSTSIIIIRKTLMVTVPSDPDDATISALQEEVLEAMQRLDAKGVVLDISAVETLDSFFARTVAETASMIALMGGRTVVVGMRPSVAVTTTQIGISLGGIETALSVERALDLMDRPRAGRPRR
jgi:rsbT antagonist protein RsbS